MKQSDGESKIRRDQETEEGKVDKERDILNDFKPGDLFHARLQAE